MNGPLFTWLRNFLSGRKQFVSVDGTYSEPSDVIRDIPRGSVLGPILFLIRISDIDANESFSTVRSFAADTCVTEKITFVEDCMYLQADLESTYEWSRISNMTFNSEKFELIRYSVHDCPIEFTYKTSENTEIIGRIKTFLSGGYYEQLGNLYRVNGANGLDPESLFDKRIITPDDTLQITGNTAVRVFLPVVESRNPRIDSATRRSAEDIH